MKKIALLFAFSASALGVFAQSLDDVRDAYGKNDLAQARALIDKILSTPKGQGKPEAWYLKGVVYNAVSKNDALKASCGDCRDTAFKAFIKYQDMDKKNMFMVIEQNASLFDLYNNYFDEGVNAFNAKDFSTAFEKFKGALGVQKYVYSKGFEYNGFKFPELDTSLVLNTATAAVQAKREDEAVPFYNMMVDAGLSAPQYIIVYQFLAEHYKKKNDDAAFAAAVAKGRSVYPHDDYWTAIEIEKVREAANKDEVFAKYEDLFAKDPTNYVVGYNYAVDLYNHIYANDDKAAGKDPKYKVKLKEVLPKVIAIKNNGETNMLMARFLYNSSFDNSDAAKKIKGVKPEDVKARKALNDAANADLNACIPYCEAAIKYFESLPKLKPMEKSNYKQSIGILQDIYQIKKDQAKVDALEAKVKALDQ